MEQTPAYGRGRTGIVIVDLQKVQFLLPSPSTPPSSSFFYFALFSLRFLPNPFFWYVFALRKHTGLH